jgi:hypothetical protein
VQASGATEIVFLGDIVGAKSAKNTLALLAGKKHKTGFFGHTHQPRVFSENDTKLDWINETTVRIPEGLACAVTVGSCGRRMISAPVGRCGSPPNAFLSSKGRTTAACMRRKISQRRVCPSNRRHAF